jgi:hypothetical protein
MTMAARKLVGRHERHDSATAGHDRSSDAVRSCLGLRTAGRRRGSRTSRSRSADDGF